MDKDIISTITNKGNKKNIELCLFLKLNSSKKGCVIYRKVDNVVPEYYGAHYDINDLEHSKFDYNFTDEEKKELTIIVKELLEA